MTFILDQFCGNYNSLSCLEHMKEKSLVLKSVSTEVMCLLPYKRSLRSGVFPELLMESHQGCGGFQVSLRCHVPGLNFVPRTRVKSNTNS